MKTKSITLLALVAALACAPALRAQDKPADKPAAKPEGAAPERPAGKGGGAAMAKERLDKMAEELKLTEAQKTKVEAAMKEQAEKRRELRDATPEDRQAKGKAMREEMDKKMKEILSAEQYEQWTKLRQEMRPGANGEGRPKAKKKAETN